MNRETRNKALRLLSKLFFLAGIVFFILSSISLNRYFRVNSDNRLPPAGEFIDGPDTFTFGVMSDSALRDEPFNAIVDDMKAKKVKFILHLGDLARKLSGNHFEHLLQSIDSHVGDMPFYAVPGNHDTSHKNYHTLKFYKRAFGQPYYWFSYGNTLFIALDTSMNNLDIPQQNWLENVLKHLRPMFKSCILLMHVPPEDPRPNESYAMVDDVDALKTIVAKYKFTALLCGHIHEYHKSTFAGVPFYITPPSGQKMRGKTTMFGYLLCTIEKDGKLTVKKLDVTDKKGRDHLSHFLSTDLDGIRSSVIAFLLMATGYVLLLLSTAEPVQSKASNQTSTILVDHPAKDGNEKASKTEQA